MAYKNSYRRDKKPRNLKQDEIDEVRKVFGYSVDLTHVYIVPPLLSEEGVMTVAGYIEKKKSWIYEILWSTAVYNKSAIQEIQHDTLIHEMTHVWQGQHASLPSSYMAESVWNQLSYGIEDIIDKGEWRTWGEHRSKAYLYNMADIGADWNRFNVEQQASIVESWYIGEMDNRRGHNRGFGEGTYGGGASPYDPRYPYIRDVILTGKPNNPYSPVVLPSGANLDIKKFQEKLIQLGYLEARFADGIVGGRGSQTRKAVFEFQKYNGLAQDGDLGGPNSDTRKKLNLPLSQLKGKPV